MKLAEGLLLRADAQKRIAQLRERLNRVVRVQEGEAPAEDPQALLAEVSRAVAQFEDMVKRINRTNAATLFDEHRTITDVIAERDSLMLERSVLDGLLRATAQETMRYSRSEIRMVYTMDRADLQRRLDDLSRRYRELDTALQQANWTVDLLM